MTSASAHDFAVLVQPFLLDRFERVGRGFEEARVDANS
jgi:hypothetical protein